MPQKNCRRILGCLVVAAAILTVAGCACPDSMSVYFMDRGRDFGECFKGSAGYAWGIHARAEALIVDAGMGMARGKKFGWDGPGGVGRAQWNKIAASALVPILFEYNVDARGVEKGAALGPFITPRFGDKIPPELPADLVHLRAIAIVTGYNWHLRQRELGKGTRVADLYWIEADVTAMPVSLRVGFNPTEFLDWLIGLGCLDMLGDDRHVAD